MTTRLVLADDHPIVLDGLEQLFRGEEGFRVVARCRDGAEAVAAVRQFAPQVLVLDIRMPGLDGLGVVRTLRESPTPTRILLLAAALDDSQVAEAVALGVAGIVLKEVAPRVLVEAVREVAAGRQWLEATMLARAVETLRRRADAVGPASTALTPRETEIVRMVASGLRNRSIGERLGIGEGTVKIHLHNIYEKLGVGGRVELTLRAQKLGLI